MALFFIKEKYSPEELESLRPLIFSSELQSIKDQTPYYRAAWILRHTDAPRIEIIWALLQASWEVSGIGVYSKYAGELLTDLQIQLADPSRDTGRDVFLRLLLGELLRRTGQFQDAETVFQNLGRELTPQSEEHKLAAYQLTLVATQDVGEHLMSEASK
jgi:hypothetical protein